MQPVKKLLWKSQGTDRIWHAAFHPMQELSCPLHYHEFYELQYILEGTGEHIINGRSVPCTKGVLAMLRPRDRHTMSVPDGGHLHLINISFLARAWRSLSEVDGEQGLFKHWETAAMPPLAKLRSGQRDNCARVFRTALQAHLEAGQEPPRGCDSLALYRFLGETLTPLMAMEQTAAPAERECPEWLLNACAAMREPENLRAGVPRLLALCHVTPTHLARTFKACFGQTPTEWVNEQRLQQASLLLATSTMEIKQVAGECGFENLSYFYRSFSARWGDAPHAYRLTYRRAAACSQGSAEG